MVKWQSISRDHNAWWKIMDAQQIWRCSADAQQMMIYIQWHKMDAQWQMMSAQLEMMDSLKIQ